VTDPGGHDPARAPERAHTGTFAAILGAAGGIALLVAGVALCMFASAYLGAVGGAVVGMAVAGTGLWFIVRGNRRAAFYGLYGAAILVVLAVLVLIGYAVWFSYFRRPAVRTAPVPASSMPISEDDEVRDIRREDLLPPR
jgi:hypothetical protein